MGVVERYLRKVKVSYAMLLDEEAKTIKRYRIPGVPTIYVPDRNNAVRAKIFGPAKKTDLEKIIRELL